MALIMLTLPSPGIRAFTGSELLGIERVATIGGNTGKSRLRQPSDVLVSDDGKIFVLDGTANRIAVFSSKGDFLYDFGAPHLSMPLGMTMDNRGWIYVTDTRKGGVHVFSPEGKHLRHIALPEGKKGIPTEPVDLAIDSRKQLLYVVDNRNHRLLVYNLENNTMERTIGTMGMRDGQFRWPFSIDVDSHGVIYVVDVINTTVRTIDPGNDWAFESNIGKWGIQKGELFRPKGVAISRDGGVFISDSYLGVIQEFSPDGDFVSVLSDSQGRIHHFTTPSRIHFGPRGRIYVVEMFANRISVFELAK